MSFFLKINDLEHFAQCSFLMKKGTFINKELQKKHFSLYKQSTSFWIRCLHKHDQLLLLPFPNREIIQITGIIQNLMIVIFYSHKKKKWG